MTIHIIGAGLGRTGTASLKVALEQLGFTPCYHMSELFQHSDHAKMWRTAEVKKDVDWPALFGDYQATVDFPGCVFYKELMDAYPNAKVLLTVRDPERWYESTYETIFQMTRLVPRWLRVWPRFGELQRMLDIYWGGLFEGKFEDRDRAIARFKTWNAEVQATVPADKLLVFEVKEGWEPLCDFLGVPVPTEPFPHVNDRAEMLTRVDRLRSVRRWTRRVVSPVVALIVFGLLWRWME